jgi:hypothetical protein
MEGKSLQSFLYWLHLFISTTIQNFGRHSRGRGSAEVGHRLATSHHPSPFPRQLLLYSSSYSVIGFWNVSLFLCFELNLRRSFAERSICFSSTAQAATKNLSCFILLPPAVGRYPYLTHIVVRRLAGNRRERGKRETVPVS